MTENNFKISKVNEKIIIEKEGQALSISQAVDEDIRFTTSKNDLSIEISMYSRNYPEWQVYMVFERLIKTIIGRYMLSGDYKNKYSRLPKDFIDLDSNIIIWHSDSGTDNILKLNYNEKTITISISKSKDALQHETNGVRIRTNGSNYEYYYQEFLDFFKCLIDLENRLNNSVENVEQKSEEVLVKRRLSLFKKHKK